MRNVKQRMRFLISMMSLCGMLNASSLCALDLILHPRVEMDTNGNAVTVYEFQPSAGGSEVRESAFTVTYWPSGSWSTAARISNSGAYATMPILGMNDNGDAVAVWTEADTTNGVNALYASARPISGPNAGVWTTPQRLSATTLHTQDDYRVRVNNSGEVIAEYNAYDMSSGNYVLYAVNYTIDGSWGTPVQIN